MKRIFLLILAFCTLVSFASCGNGGKKEPPAPTANIKAWTMHSFEKTIVNIAPKGNFTTDYTVYLAKGETEGCQVAIYSDTEFKNATFNIASGETEVITPSMFSMERSHKIGKKEYTDSLIPYYGKRLNIEKGRILAFMVEFKTTKDTPAGEYKYVYELKDREKNVIASYNITVHVWDFTLPEKKTFATAVGLQAAFIGYHKGVPEEWYNTLLDHNMSAYDLPYEILDPRADAYMSNPRVTAFRVVVPMNEDRTKIDEKKLLEIYKKLLTNDEWLKKAYFYPLDEPHTKEQLAELRQWEKTLTRLCPKIEICAPFYTNIKVGTGRDQTDDMAEYTDLWCPKLCLWDDERSYGDFLDYTPSKSFEERMNDQIAKGDRMWAYVCNDPDDPYAQLFMDTEGANQRLMFWQMYQRDIEGFLYWSACWYGFKDGLDPWKENPDTNVFVALNPWEISNPYMTDANGVRVYGEGYLLYPGIDVGYGGAVPSIRAKIVRDGIDDIEMFYLAEGYLGKDWIKAKTYEGTPSITEFTSGDNYVKLRIEIGNALEAALKK